MKTKVMARPKGSPYPFQPAKEVEKGMYALQFTLGSGWKHTAFYEEEELEVKR